MKWHALIYLFWNSIHNLGLVGHIEDIVVNKDQQGKKLGLRIIEALDYIAEKVGCYKVSPLVLNCFTPPGLLSPFGRSAGLGFHYMRRIAVPSLFSGYNFLYPLVPGHAPVRHPTPPTALSPRLPLFTPRPPRPHSNVLIARTPNTFSR